MRFRDSSNPKGFMFMGDQPELREGVLVWGRAPSPVQAERTGAPVKPGFGLTGWNSSAAARRHRNSEFAKSGAALYVLVLLLMLAQRTSWATGSPPAGQQPLESPSQAGANFGTITPYLGLAIDQIELPDVPPEEAATLLATTPLKVGEPLTREALHDTMQALFATGRFSDIQAEADRTDTGGVRLRFLTTANFFVGMVLIKGVSTNPSANQLASATRLQLGELYAPEKIDRALTGIQRVMEENGFHQSKVTTSEQRDEPQHEVNLTFRVVPGPHAAVGEITLEGDAGYSVEAIKDIAKLHSGDLVRSNRITRALQRIRRRYQKQNRLLAQVSVASRTYQSKRNTVDFVFKVDRGPVVQIAAEGFKLSQRVLHRLVPIYEEGAVDDDLLNEGRRNIQNHLQTLGYFDASVSVSQHSTEGGKDLQVVYAVNPGDRHKLAAIRISGNRFFSDDLIRSRMQDQSAGRLFSHGRYSEVLLEEDVRSIEDLYRASGFRQAEVTSKLVDKYQGEPSQLAIEIVVKEGPQTRVAWVRVEGSYTLPQEQLPEIQTEEGQAFDESSLADDRDTILGKYFDNGFPNATVDVAYVSLLPSDNLPRVGVTFSIHEGEQFFVNRVFVDGLHHTRPGVARRAIRVQPGGPLSQKDMLESQRRLYDLGLFKQVDTAIQNPDGTESRKNVLVTASEAERYTFDYGGGFEFQTGQPTYGINQPLGQTGVSPMVSGGVSRINVGGRHQTLSLKGNLGRLQQRALSSYDVPKLLNLENFRFTATALYDNTVDVSTFTSKRLEGTLQVLQVLYKMQDRELTTFAYRFSYRRVEANNIEITSNLIPLLSTPTRVGVPNFLYVRNRRDNDLESTRGSYTTVEGGVASGYFGSEADFSRFSAKNSTYHTFFRKRSTGQGYVFARSTTVGIENPFGSTVLLDPAQPVPAGRTLVPLPERFFSGGGNSNRGFGLNQAGPRDPFTGFPVGGSAVFLNSLEMRFPNVMVPYLHDNIGFTIFEDMGNVFARPQEMLSSLGRFHQPGRDFCFQEQTHNLCNYNYASHAVGLGVRYQTPIGPLRFDFGYNLNPPYFPSYYNIVTNTVNGQQTGQFGYQRAGHFNFSFSVGQSF
ncbi:MAG TPA: POTRA domain-containing protein [Terriglobales bacterium]|nr:POTRA domain-containing protein [Terriglobales bacterium]